MSNEPRRLTERVADAPEELLRLVRDLQDAPPLPPDLRGIVRSHLPTVRARWLPPKPLVGASLVLGTAFAVWLGTSLEPIERPRGHIVAPVDEHLDSFEEPQAPGVPAELPPPATSPLGEDGLAMREPPLPPPTTKRPRGPAPRSMRAKQRRHVRDELVSSDSFEVATMGESGRGGTLVINTIPWARVFVDGRNTGQTTPAMNIRVPAGRHVVGLQTQNGEMHRVVVNVQPGDTVRIMRRLESPPALVSDTPDDPF